jgi:ferredoxin-NADP reductase
VIEELAGTPAPTGGWRRARVAEVSHPSRRSVVLRLDVPDRVDHIPGQHYVIRLTAPDGYIAQRSYSVASAPSDPLLELFVERLDDGEVSTYLADVVQRGDELEVRGPIGGWFVWGGQEPAVGVAGGSGVVPFIAMLRHAADLGRSHLLRLCVSARTRVDLPYADELTSQGAIEVLSREDIPGGRPRGRLSAADISELLTPAGLTPAGLTSAGLTPAVPSTFFVCGSAAFAETASVMLVDAGISERVIRVERFGPSG